MFLAIEKTSERYSRILFVWVRKPVTDILPKCLMDIEFDTVEHFGDLGELSHYDKSEKVCVPLKDIEFYLDEVAFKNNLLLSFSEESFKKMNTLIPAYKLTNILLGVDYEDYTKEEILNTVKEFRKEYYRLKGKIESAKNKEDTDKIFSNFPKNIIKETL